MEQEILNHLIKKYNPVGIILHGSRGAGDARTHSDWDFFVFTETHTPNKRESSFEVYNNQSLDILVLEVLLYDEELITYIAKFIGSSRLVYHTDDRLPAMFDNAKRVYDLGVSLTNKEIDYQHKLLSRDITRLSDWIDEDSGIFYLRCADIYRRIYNLWWKIKKKQYSISPRRGLETIKLDDLEFYITLDVLVKDKSNFEKYEAVKKLETLLFKWV